MRLEIGDFCISEMESADDNVVAPPNLLANQ